MLLSQRFSHLFPPHIRSQGEAYFAGGKVESFHTCDIHYFAHVEGTEFYTVGMDFLTDENDLGVSCSCLYHRRNGLCKHIWAALLGADAEHALTAANTVHTRVSDLVFDEMEKIIDQVEASSVYTSSRKRVHPKPRPSSPIHDVPHSSKTFSAFPVPPGKTEWSIRLARLRDALERGELEHPRTARNQGSGDKEIFYVLNAKASMEKEEIVIDIGHRERKKKGEWGQPRFQGIRTEDIPSFPHETDRQILGLLSRGEGVDSWRYYYNYATRMRYELPLILAPLLLPMMSSLNRLFISRSGDAKNFLAVHYDAGPPWEAFLKIEEESEKEKEGPKNNLALQVKLRNGREEIFLHEVELILPGKLLLMGDRLAPLADTVDVGLLRSFMTERPISFPADSLEEALRALALFPVLLPLESSGAVPLETIAPEPQPLLRLRRQAQQWGGDQLQGKPEFNYDGLTIPFTDTRPILLDPEGRRIILRNHDAEGIRRQELRDSGFGSVPGYNTVGPLQISIRKFASAAVGLIRKGWHIEAEGKLYRTGGSLEMRISSGIDWFDLDGKATFDNAGISFPELLEAIARGDEMVRLDDGTYGLLPEEWIRRYGRLAKAAKTDGKSLRFGANQVVLLDMLLADMPEAEFDDTFRKGRERLHSFGGILPLDPPASFTGELRPYQKTALGWFRFLREFGFGGCLADDMGLGKTVQALALLEGRRLERHEGKKTDNEEPGRPKGPSLAVVPKSLIFNWVQEAARFAPNLRVLDYTGPNRREFQDRLEEFDLILTTYGTLRRDAPKLRETVFDYLILDESQAIKNEKSATAKAARLLKGEHRLAMSGTPIENRIEELWSLFEFLNPGMLGSATIFTALAGSPDSREARKGLAESLRPLILRRTKESVAADLPEKVEQTIFCELDKTQRKLYNELRDHFRASVLQEIDDKGMARSKIKVLEALLRLRQAACHPGLINKTKGELDSAKFDLLLPRLQELVEEGHKALVFSQFTGLLALLRPQLEEQGIRYVYLDGRTRNRQEKVEEFQNDPDCSLFLISLKAGGVGLNLTSAEYVFLLDPWWNPAVEAQAIDRTHRIGQKNNVFAYRLIAKDTVEEKVLELQERKRELAEAIISGDNALVRDLAREDLEMLLS